MSDHHSDQMPHGSQVSRNDLPDIVQGARLIKLLQHYYFAWFWTLHDSLYKMTVAHYSGRIFCQGKCCSCLDHFGCNAQSDVLYCTNGISMVVLYRFAEKLSPKVRGKNLNFPHNQPNEKKLMCVQSRFPSCCIVFLLLWCIALDMHHFDGALRSFCLTWSILENQITEVSRWTITAVKSGS